MSYFTSSDYPHCVKCLEHPPPHTHTRTRSTINHSHIYAISWKRILHYQPYVEGNYLMPTCWVKQSSCQCFEKPWRSHDITILPEKYMRMLNYFEPCPIWKCIMTCWIICNIRGSKSIKGTWKLIITWNDMSVFGDMMVKVLMFERDVLAPWYGLAFRMLDLKTRFWRKTQINGGDLWLFLNSFISTQSTHCIISILCIVTSIHTVATD